MKCIHAGKSVEIQTVDYTRNDDGIVTSEKRKTVSDWSPHDCIETECACFIDGNCNCKS